MKRAARAIDLTLEREVQRDVIDLFESLGCVVARLSQYHRLGSGTRQAVGLPDLFVFPPLRARPPLPFFVEVKAPSGRQSGAQREWQLLCEARGLACLVGGTEAAIAHARTIGLVSDPARRPVPRQASVHGAQG